MKVAIITDTFLPQTNGVVTSICSQIKGLVEKGIEVVVIAPGEQLKKTSYEGATVYYVQSKAISLYPGYRVAWPYHTYASLPTILKIENPDLYHIETPMPLGVTGLWWSWMFNKPVLSTYHTHLESYSAHLIKGRMKGLAEFAFGKQVMPWLRVYAHYNETIIVPGREMEKMLNNHGIKNTTVITNGFDSEKFSKQKYQDIRKKYKIPKNSKIILYLGRISFEKKIDILLKAFKTINDEDENAYLVIVGSGPSLEKTKEEVREMGLNNVIFTGYVEDKYLASFYKQCDVFASASDTETQGIVFVEAMSFGKPVIGPNKLGAKDTITDGKNGYLFEAGNFKDLAGKIKKIIYNKTLSKKMGIASKKMVKIYSNEKSIKKTVALYKKTIKKWEKRPISKIESFKNMFHKLKDSFHNL